MLRHILTLKPWTFSVVMAGILGWAAEARAGGPLPDCHILAVGIDAYEQSPLRGCANDARVVSRHFSSQQGKLFGKVTAHVLVDHQATGDRIDQELTRIQKVGKEGDFVMLFFSGHGGPDHEGHWGFVAIDRVISDRALLPIADRLASQGKKVVIFLDACFAGLLRVHAKQHLNKAYPKGGGLILLLSSMASQPTAAGRDMSPFAQAVVEGLSGKGDLDGDGFVSLREVRRYAHHRTHEINRNTRQDGEVDYSLSISENLRLAQVDKNAVRPVIVRAQAPEEAAAMPKLMGTEWASAANRQGFRALTFVFLDKSEVVMIDKAGGTSGTWSQNGKQVRLTFETDDGQVIYTGTLRNNVLSGTATGPGGRTWNWSVTLQSTP